MRLVIQRVKEASVSIDQQCVGRIDQGYMILVGITDTDIEKDIDYLVRKIKTLRLFEDESGKMNQNIEEVGGSILSISQFTLYGDAKKGTRPNFSKAAKADIALPLYDQFNEALHAAGLKVVTGVFGADMQVSLVNDGPVTLILESAAAVHP